MNRKWAIVTRFCNFQPLHRPYPSNSLRQKFIIIISLSWSRKSFINVATNMAEYSYPGDETAVLDILWAGLKITLWTISPWTSRDLHVRRGSIIDIQCTPSNACFLLLHTAQYWNFGGGSLRAQGRCRGLKAVKWCFYEDASYSLVQTFAAWCSSPSFLATVIHSVTA